MPTSTPSSSANSVGGDEKASEKREETIAEQIDLVAYYENNAGRLVVDPA